MKQLVLTLLCVALWCGSAGAGLVNNQGTTSEDSVVVSMYLGDTLNNPVVIDTTLDSGWVTVISPNGDSVYSDAFLLAQSESAIEIYTIAPFGDVKVVYKKDVATLDGTTGLEGVYKISVWLRDSSLHLWTPFEDEFQLLQSGDLSSTIDSVIKIPDKVTLVDSSANGIALASNEHALDSAHLDSLVLMNTRMRDTLNEVHDDVQHIQLSGTNITTIAESSTLTDGTETNTYAATANHDGVYYQVAEGGTGTNLNINFYLEFDIGADTKPVSIDYHGRLDEGGAPFDDTIHTYAYDWDGALWTHVHDPASGDLGGIFNSDADDDKTFKALLIDPNFVGTGGDVGKVRVSFSNYDPDDAAASDLDETTELFLDLVFLEYQSLLTADAIWASAGGDSTLNALDYTNNSNAVLRLTGDGDQVLTLEQIAINSSAAGGAIDIDNSVGNGISIFADGTGYHGIYVDVDGIGGNGLFFDAAIGRGIYGLGLVAGIMGAGSANGHGFAAIGSGTGAGALFQGGADEGTGLALRPDLHSYTAAGAGLDGDSVIGFAWTAMIDSIQAILDSINDHAPHSDDWGQDAAGNGAQTLVLYVIDTSGTDAVVSNMTVTVYSSDESAIRAQGVTNSDGVALANGLDTLTSTASTSYVAKGSLFGYTVPSYSFTTGSASRYQDTIFCYDTGMDTPGASSLKRIFVDIADLSDDTTAVRGGWMTVQFVAPEDDIVPRDTTTSKLVGIGEVTKTVPANGTINGKGSQTQPLGRATIDLLRTDLMTPDNCRYKFTVFDANGVKRLEETIVVEGSANANLVDLID